MEICHKRQEDSGVHREIKNYSEWIREFHKHCPGTLKHPQPRMV